MTNKLRLAINDSIQIIKLEYSTSFPASGLIQIENEVIQYTFSSDLFLLNCTRGANGTTAASHTLGTEVTEVSVPLEINNVLVGYKTNATSLRVSGKDVNGAYVQSYSGIFSNPDYSLVGALDTRFITGGNLEMDVELQSPHALRLIAGDNSTTDAFILMSSNKEIRLQARAENEVVADHYLVVDRLDTTIHGITNTSEVNLKANSGSLHLNSGVTTGAIVLPTLTSTQRTALSPVIGMVLYNSSDNTIEVYNGSTWKVVAFTV